MKTLNPSLASALLLVVSTVIVSSAFPHRAIGQTANGEPASSAPAAASAQTVVPALVPYSGIALSNDGNVLTGEVGITFLIFKDEQGGEPLWTETQMATLDQLGHYRVQLGASYPSGLPLGLFSTGEARWLEIQIAGEKPQPRVLVASVPYAFKAADAATLGGLPASAFALAGSALTGSRTLTPLAVPDGASPDTTTTVTTGGGTSGYVPQFFGASAIGDSIIFATGNSVGIGTIPNSGAKLDVGGSMIMRGNMTVSRTGNATASRGFPSYGFDFFSNMYNSSTKAGQNAYFQLQSEPTGNNTSSPSATFNLLFSNNGAPAAETGLYIKPTGILNFAAGQTFPGAGTITGITTGTGLVGGGSSGNIMLNTTAVLSVLAGTGLTETASSAQNLTLSNAGILAVTAGSGLLSTGGQSPSLRVDPNVVATFADGGHFDSDVEITSGDSVQSPLYVDNSTTETSDLPRVFETYADNTAQFCETLTSGDLFCSGTITGATKHFRIDHPLDPANKYLVHSSVESSEMMNIYSGNVVTDEQGVATVTLPEWFESENGDFRYQLTTIGQDAHAWISEEIHDSKFIVSTNAQHVKVSWQVTAVRQDAYAKAHPLVVEEAKPAEELGTYMHPELFGQPKEKGTGWTRHAKQVQRMKAHREAATTRPTTSQLPSSNSAGSN